VEHSLRPKVTPSSSKQYVRHIFSG
jgi:hypothetical protein